VGKLVALIVIVVSVVIGLVLLVAVAAGSGAGGPSSSTGTATGAGGGPGSGGSEPGPAVPATWLLLYQEAAATCPGLSWSILAAVGTVESDNGRSTAPGVRSGANSAGAEGPMQFEPTNSCKRNPEHRANRCGGSTPPGARSGCREKDDRQ